MFVTYHRVGRISLLPALAAGAAAVIVLGVAAITLVVGGVAACGVRLLRAIGRIGPAERRASFEDHRTIEGVVVDSRPSHPLGDLDQQPHEQRYGRARDKDRQRAQ